MQHMYDKMNRFPSPSSGCIGPSKSIATSSQHSNQEGFTATAACCFIARFLPRMQVKQLSLNLARSLSTLSHQQTFRNRACILLALLTISVELFGFTDGFVSGLCVPMGSKKPRHGRKPPTHRRATSFSPQCWIDSKFWIDLEGSMAQQAIRLFIYKNTQLDHLYV